jgi:hypothetical protein
MKNDLSPYTCIVENCPSPYDFYLTRNGWREHVLRDHPPKWRCSCCTGTRPVFQSLPSFMAHLDEQHENDVSDEAFVRIMAKSTFRSFGITNCPLCNDCGPADSPELIEHVLGHIYDFSMYALPWRTVAQRTLKRPIRTFNDVAPILCPDDNAEVAQTRTFNHTRILKWVREPQPEEWDLTPEQKRAFQDLHCDDYQAVEDEDGTELPAGDYFDRAGIDYFEYGASSQDASSQTDRSAGTRHLSTASSYDTLQSVSRRVSDYADRLHLPSIHDETDKLDEIENNLDINLEAASPSKSDDMAVDSNETDLDVNLEFETSRRPEDYNSPEIGGTDLRQLSRLVESAEDFAAVLRKLRDDVPRDARRDVTDITGAIGELYRLSNVLQQLRDVYESPRYEHRLDRIQNDAGLVCRSAQRSMDLALGMVGLASEVTQWMVWDDLAYRMGTVERMPLLTRLKCYYSFTQGLLDQLEGYQLDGTLVRIKENLRGLEQQQRKFGSDALPYSVPYPVIASSKYLSLK